MYSRRMARVALVAVMLKAVVWIYTSCIRQVQPQERGDGSRDVKGEELH